MRTALGVRPGVKFLAVGLAAAMIGLPSVGLAQVAPPPPPPVEKPKLKAPPPRPPRRPAPPPKPTQSKARPAPEIKVPDIAYEPIAKFDEDGKLIRIEGSVDLLALKHNPTIGPKTIEKIRPALLEWKQSLDRMVVDNLDIIQDVDNGLFEGMDPKDQDQMVLLNEVFKILIGIGKPNSILANTKALTKTQMDFQRKLVNDYTQAASKESLEEIKARIPGDDAEAKNQQTLEFSRATLTDMSKDAVRSYYALLLEAAARADAVLPGLTLTTEEQAVVAAPMKAVKAAGTDQQKTDAVKALLTALGPMRQREFMKAVLEARGPATMPELDDAAIKPNGAPPVEDIDGASGG